MIIISPMLKNTCLFFMLLSMLHPLFGAASSAPAQQKKCDSFESLRKAVTKNDVPAATEIVSTGTITKNQLGLLVPVAAAEGHSAMVAFLLNNGANLKINSFCFFGGSPIIQALFSSHTSEIPLMVKLLVDAGDNVNAINGFAETPLHIIAGKKSVKPADAEYVIKLLLHAGAKRDARRQSPCVKKPAQTPAEWARLAGHDDRAKLIESYDPSTNAEPILPSCSAAASSSGL